MFTTGGAPMGSGLVVQSGNNVLPGEPRGLLTLAFGPGDEICMLSSAAASWFSSHFSRATSDPPVLSELVREISIVRARKAVSDNTDPAKDPPTHAIVAGVNAGARPAFLLPSRGGDGLFRIATCGMSGLSTP